MTTATFKASMWNVKKLTMTDYDKAKAECWREYRAKGDVFPTARETFDWTFEQAYRYGRWVGMEEAIAQPASTPDMFGNSEQLRVQAAIAAMQGLLSNPDITARYEMVLDDAVHDAVLAANYLLAELDKTKDDGK